MTEKLHPLAAGSPARKKRGKNRPKATEGRILWRKPDVAKKLGVTTRTLDRWRNAGLGPKQFVVGTNVFYKTEDLNEWLNASGVTDAQFR